MKKKISQQSNSTVKIIETDMLELKGHTLKIQNIHRKGFTG